MERGRRCCQIASLALFTPPALTTTILNIIHFGYITSIGVWISTGQHRLFAYCNLRHHSTIKSVTFYQSLTREIVTSATITSTIGSHLQTYAYSPPANISSSATALAYLHVHPGLSKYSILKPTLVCLQVCSTGGRWVES